jgi:hypothetical protein
MLSISVVQAGKFDFDVCQNIFLFLDIVQFAQTQNFRLIPLRHGRFIDNSLSQQASLTQSVA